MALPNAVKKQTEAANRMIEELGNVGAATATPETPTAPAVAETPVAADPPLEQASATEEGFKPLTQPLGDDDAKWEHRYQSLQGKYNAEVPRLLTEIRSLKEQLQSINDRHSVNVQALRDEITQLKQQPAQAAVAPANIQELRASYGDELADWIIAFVRQELAPVQRRVEDFGTSVSQVTAQNREAALKQLVIGAGVNYEQRNNDPLFLQWLGQVDPLAGATRQSLLDQAYSTGDLQRAANFFTAYDGQQPTGSRTTPPDLNQHITPNTTAPQVDKARVVEPWNEARIADFYQRKTRGEQGLSGGYTKEEAARLEQELFAYLNQR